MNWTFDSFVHIQRNAITVAHVWPMVVSLAKQTKNYLIINQSLGLKTNSIHNKNSERQNIEKLNIVICITQHLLLCFWYSHKRNENNDFFLSCALRSLSNDSYSFNIMTFDCTFAHFFSIFFLALWSSPSMRPLYVNQLWTNFRNWLSSSTAYTTEFQWSSPAYLLHLSFVISWCTVLVSFSASRAPSISKINWINTPNIVLTNILTSRKGAWHNKTMIRRNKFEEKKWRKSNESSYLLVSFRNNFFWRTMPLQIINIMKIVCRSRIRNIFFLSCSVSYNNITSYTEYEFVDNIWISEQLIRCWMPWTVVQFIRFLPIDFIMVRIGDRTPISNARIIYR